MATRFYLENSGVAAVSPSFDTNWEQQGQGDRVKLSNKVIWSGPTTLTDKTITIPGTTTQEILSRQFVSDPMRSQNITGVFSMVNRGLEDNIGDNCFLAYSLRVVSNDGGTVRGTLASSFTNAGTEYAATAATRIFGDGVTTIAITALTCLTGDRLVLEVGAHAESPGAAGGTVTQRFGSSAASDFALTSALTTDLNPWMEISQNIRFVYPLNNSGLRPHPFSPGLAR